MYIKHRNYSDEQKDFRLVCDFIITNNDYITNMTSWSFQRFVDWRFGLYEHRTGSKQFWDDNLILFFDALEKLIGLAICENGDESIFILTSSKHRLLFNELLDLTLEIWHDKAEILQIEISEKQISEMECLISKGFRQSNVFYKQCFDLTANLTKKTQVAPNFSIIDMSSTPLYEKQARLRASAFNGQDALTEEQLGKRLEIAYFSHKSPTYYAYTDLCVINEQGIAVSGCEPLINLWCSDAEIERVCTHREYRKKGLAQALIIEALYRLKEIGIERAYITGYSHEAISLYQQLGAKNTIRMFVYERKTK